jgi:hypothetical protein
MNGCPSMKVHPFSLVHPFCFLCCLPCRLHSLCPLSFASLLVLSSLHFSLAHSSIRSQGQR